MTVVVTPIPVEQLVAGVYLRDRRPEEPDLWCVVDLAEDRGEVLLEDALHWIEREERTARGVRKTQVYLTRWHPVDVVCVTHDLVRGPEATCT